MRMGRTKLYGKVKELSGDYTVSDVCYKLGLEDVSYFNKCFKSYYGVSPSKYGK